MSENLPSVEHPANTGKCSNTSDTSILKKGPGTTGAHQGLTAFGSFIEDDSGAADSNHFDGL